MKLAARNIVKNTGGSVLMEYVIITGIFLLAVGGVVYFDGQYTNLFAVGMPDNYAAGTTVNDELLIAPVEEASTAVKRYGLVGDNYSSRVKLALEVVASPLP